MTADCSALGGTLDVLRGEITCRQSPDASVLVVTTGRFFSDGDAVELFLRPTDDGERVIISDGGLTRARFELAGSPTLAGKPKTLWHDILVEFGVREHGNRIYLSAKKDAAAAGISLLADACVALDSVHLLTAGERRTFTDKVRNWLESEVDTPVKGTTVIDKFGVSQAVTALVESPRGDVIVQAAGGRKVAELRSSMEHAFWVMGGLDDSTHPVTNRLTLLESVPSRKDTQDTLRGLTRRLAEISYVGSFECQISAHRFLQLRNPPVERDFVFSPLGQIAAPTGYRSVDTPLVPRAIEPPSE